MLVHGYYTALRIHAIHEDVPNMGSKFGTWAMTETGWVGFNCGWGYAFDNNTPENEDALTRLFTYIDLYRLLKPTVTARVVLTEEQRQACPHRLLWVDNGSAPRSLSVVNYAPSNLNHLRFHYSDYVEDDGFLMLNDGSFQTKLSDLFDRVADTIGLGHDEWDSGGSLMR